MSSLINKDMSSKRKNKPFKPSPFEQPSVAVDRLIKSVTATTPHSPKTSKANFDGNFSKVLNNFNLKKFGGKNDVDFDGVINKFDCNPFSVMRQDFSPFRNQSKAEQMSAARRFGGQNLKGLKKLGQGRDRVVYELDKDKVLKVAKNPGGLTQNTSESDLAYLEMGKHYETGLDYAVMGKNKPLSTTGRKKLAKVRKAYNEEVDKGGRNAVNAYGRQQAPIQLVRRSERFSGDNSVLDETGIGRDILDYEFNPHELFANRQWGENEQGELVLNDGGALQDNDSLTKHRVKDFSHGDWQSKDWNEVQRQRTIHRGKGNYVKRDPIQNNSNLPNESFNQVFGDDDGDGVLNYNDCVVDDPDKQGPWHSKQTLWHAGDKPPSQTLKEEGRVFGFSSKQYADGWKEKHNKQNIYRFTTDDYKLDDKSYVRPLPGGKKTMSDNEYISLGVDNEDIVEDTLQVPPGQLTLAEQQKLKSYMFLNEANDGSAYTFKVVDKREGKVVMEATSKKDGSSYTYEINESEL